MLPQTAPLIDAWPCAGLRLDAEGRVLEINLELAGRLGCDRSAFAGRPLGALLSVASRLLWESALWPAMQTRRRLDDGTLVFETPAGPWFAAAALRFESGDTAAAIACWLLPAGEREKLQGALRSARRSLDAMPGAVLQCRRLPSGDLDFAYASAGVLDLLGVTPTQVVGHAQALLAALTPTDRVAFEASLAAAEATCAAHWRVIVHAARAPLRALEWVAQRDAQPDGTELWHGMLHDVSERERLQTELRDQGVTDELTRLPNRRGLLLRLQNAIDASRPFALMFMDVDRFKQINDSLGHEAGDELLREVARRLRSALRSSDQLLQFGGPETAPLAARLGGDEFVVLVDGIADAAGASALAERLRARLAKPHQLGRLTVHSGVSIGIAMGHGACTAAQLMRDADTAMYEAKRTGRGRFVHFEAGMHERAAQALELEGALRDALRSGQLRAVFQPIVEIATGRVVGMEALARWRHPERGEISPVIFVPVAEETGLIAAVGEEILRQACLAFRGWQRAGLPTPPRMSVNLSRAQLLDPGLPLRLQAIIEATELPCSALQFEITESLAMQDDAVRSVLQGLRELGLQLALDDFGTGHSSLAALQRFPVQQVKIDRSFVREVETSAYHRALVQAALQVAAALQLEVVAEGVETDSQARCLSALGCARAQGYLYSRPLEGAAMTTYLGDAAQRLPGRPPSVDIEMAGHLRAHQVVITDAAGLTVFVNPAFSLATGYTLDDMRGRKPGQVLQGLLTDARAVQRLRDAQSSGQGVLGVEIVNYRKDGTPFWVVVDIEPLRDAAGRIERFVSVQTEITQQRRTQAELAGLRQDIERVRELGLVGFWGRDLATGKGEADATTRRLFGVPEHEPVPDWPAMLARLTPESRPALQEYIDALQAGATRGMTEYTVRHDDGRLVHLQTSWTRRDHRVLGVLVDVSGSVQVRRERDQLVQQLELAAAAAQQVFWRHDLASGEVEWLPAQGHAYPTDARGRTHASQILQDVLAEDRAIVQRARAAAVAGDGVIEAIYRVRSAAGDVRHLLTRRIALRDADGTPRQLLGVSIDITQQRHQQAQMETLALQNELVLEAAHMASFRLDLQHWVYSFGPAFAALYGLPEGSTGLAWDDWLTRVHPDDLPALLERARRLSVIGPRLMTRSRFRILMVTGEVRWIEAHRQVLRDDAGAAVAAIGAHRDITDEVNVANTAQALAQAQGARAERALLLAGANHELRTPLNAVLGFAQLLSAGAAGAMTDKALAYLGSIQAAGTTLLRLSDDLGQLGRLDAGAVALHIDRVDLDGLVRAALELVEPQAGEAGIGLTLEDGKPWGHLHTDGRHLQQVLVNLLSNGVKYNRQGGRVVLACSRTGGRCLISVTDTGLGMDAVQLARLFTAFDRAGREAGPVAGSGLGLMLSRGWVRAMGGELSVESQPGQGSVFTVALPDGDA